MTQLKTKHKDIDINKDEDNIKDTKAMTIKG